MDRDTEEGVTDALEDVFRLADQILRNRALVTDIDSERRGALVGELDAAIEIQMIKEEEMSGKKKWSEFYGKLLPKDPFEDRPGHRERVEQAKAAYIGLSTSEMVRAMRIEKDKKEECEAAVSAIEIELGALSELIFADLHAQGVENMRVEGAGTVYPKFDPQVSLKDPIANRLWAIEHGLEDKLGLPWSTLNAVAKEFLEKGEEVPGCEVYMKTSAVLLRK